MIREGVSSSSCPVHVLVLVVVVPLSRTRAWHATSTPPPPPTSLPAGQQIDKVKPGEMIGISTLRVDKQADR